MPWLACGQPGTAELHRSCQGSRSSKEGFPLCQNVQWCSRTALCAGHRPLDLLGDCPPNPSGTGVNQGVSQMAEQSWHPRAVPGHEMAWAQGQRRKGQPVEIPGWMRPSRDVTVAGATLLSEVITIKLLVAKTCTGNFRQVHLGWITFLWVSVHLALHSEHAGAIGSFITCSATSLGGECFRNDLR